MRAFLAVPLEQPALGAAQRLLAALRQRVEAVRWARGETLHVTLHFFGAVDDAQTAAAIGAATPLAASTRRFSMTLDALGAFPDSGVPRVLWLGQRSTAADMEALARRTRDALRDAGFQVEARPFRPHCTLGRTRAPWPPAAREAWDAAAADVAPLTFVARRLVLYESTTRPDGALYTPRAELAFAAS